MSVDLVDRYSVDERIDAALAGLGAAGTRDEYEHWLSRLAQAARAKPDEIISIFRRGGFEPIPLVWCLHGHASPIVTCFFSELLAHRDQYVRWAAAEGLVASGRSNFEPQFIAALRDRSDLVKGVAVYYLRRHGSRRSLPALRHVLTLKGLSKRSPGILSEAKAAIGRIQASV